MPEWQSHRESLDHLPMKNETLEYRLLVLKHFEKSHVPVSGSPSLAHPVKSTISHIKCGSGRIP
jgi:hypothetical protein